MIGDPNTTALQHHLASSLLSCFNVEDYIYFDKNLDVTLYHLVGMI